MCSDSRQKCADYVLQAALDTSIPLRSELEETVKKYIQDWLSRFSLRSRMLLRKEEECGAFHTRLEVASAERTRARVAVQLVMQARKRRFRSTSRQCLQKARVMNVQVGYLMLNRDVDHQGELLNRRYVRVNALD